MAYKKLKIICDADDVLISCNAYALQLLSHLNSKKKIRLLQTTLFLLETVH